MFGTLANRNTSSLWHECVHASAPRTQRHEMQLEKKGVHVLEQVRSGHTSLPVKEEHAHVLHVVRTSRPAGSPTIPVLSHEQNQPQKNTHSRRDMTRADTPDNANRRSAWCSSNTETA